MTDIPTKDIRDDYHYFRLFKDVMCTHSPKWDRYFYWHLCNNTDEQIFSDGCCGRCKKFIASHKKLDVIRALKELTE